MEGARCFQRGISLYERFRFECSFSEISEPIQSLLGESNPCFATDESISILKETAVAYEKFKDKCRNGVLGENAKFWVCYIDFVKMQERAQTAIQEGDFDARLAA